MPHTIPDPIPIYQAIILGIVQGITEFLPISSTGHLRLIPRLLGWQDGGFTFDAALHTGTLLAVLIYFWRDWIEVLKPVARAAMGKHHVASPHFGRNLFWGIVIGCIPAGMAALLLKDTIDRIEHADSLNTVVMAVVSAALILVAFILYAADKHGSKKKKRLAQMNFLDWVIIGVAQAVALVPGVSRSGATISAGLFRGLDRNTAARFSFLLSTPIFLAGALLHILDVAKQGMSPQEIAPSLAGAISSAIVGIIVIRFLLNYLRRHSVNIFVWYRIALGVIVLTLIVFDVV